MHNSAIALENYGIKKLTQSVWKQFFSAFLGGILIGLAYTATLIMICDAGVDDSAALKVISKVIGSVFI